MNDEELHQELRSIHDAFGEVRSEIREHIVRCDGFFSVVQSHDLELDGRPGNGMGLKTRVRVAESNIGDLQDDSRSGRKWKWGLAAGMFVLLAGVVLEMLAG